MNGSTSGSTSGPRPRPRPRRRPGRIARLYRTAHAYVYARWTKQYVWAILRVWPLFSRKAKDRAAHTYHAKVLTEPLAGKVITLNERIVLRDLEHVIPFQRARDIILNGSPDITVYDCACREARPKAERCSPTRVCMVIGGPARAILRMHPGKSEALSRKAALKIIEDEHARGHIQTAWFKDVFGDRFYAICNCCKCCCAGIEVQVKRGIRIMEASGFAPGFSAEVCTACGRCTEACPFLALRAGRDGKPILDLAPCLGCGACEAVCRNGAVRMVRDERQGVPMDLDDLAGRKVSGSVGGEPVLQ